MKTIVLFTSNTGFTKQYANWLVNDLSCPWIDLSKKNGSISMNTIRSYLEAGSWLENRFSSSIKRKIGSFFA